ncbi:MAG: hypothetical protein AB1295_01965 [Candidatus Micrarchaeota archaeon]
MKVTSRETYKVIRAVLEMKTFKQYQISKKEKVTFSLVNRIVNWLVAQRYVAKRTGYYELVSPSAILALFPLYRKIKPRDSLDVAMPAKEVLGMLKGKGVLCLTSALAYYDEYFRDPAIHVYLDDEKISKELKGLPKGYTHIEIYREDLNSDDFVTVKGQRITKKIRTVADLFCANKAYTAERLIKKEWI